MAASRQLCRTTCTRPLRRFATQPSASGETVKPLTEQEQKRRFSSLAYRSFGLMLVTGAAIYAYFDIEKAKAAKEREAAMADQAIGRPKIGGPFQLIDHNGKRVTDADFRGKFTLLYFGFTNCPDICPEELDKMAEALNVLDADPLTKEKVTPVFISCDPKRDSVDAVREYVKEFHPRLIGLTGKYEDIKATAKAYRVYFSSPPPEEEGDDDYLVDHSIFMYFMDPNGQFVDAFGRNLDSKEIVKRVHSSVVQWRS
ncbi:Cu-binding protein [Sorochytrium milnesiophthora]